MAVYTKDDLPEGTLLISTRGEYLEVASDEYHAAKTVGDVWLTKGTYLDLGDIGPDCFAEVINKVSPPRRKGFAGWVNKMEKELT